MRVIFLDTDGVLNNGVARITHLSGASKLTVPLYDPKCVERFNRLVRESQARVVISATWGHSFTTEMLEQHLQQQGIVCEVLGQTPIAEKWRPRGRDIAEWLQSWQGEAVEAFCILDDHDDMAELKRYLVRTDYRGGLQEQHVDQALRLLT